MPSPLHAILFILLAIGCTILAIANGGAAWVALWPALSFLIVAAAYMTGNARLLGKRADGRIGLLPFVLLLPYLMLSWAIWWVMRWLEGAASHEVAPGVWVGRRAGCHELPPGTALVVDMTAEFWEPRGVCTACATYLCVPTLDACVPTEPMFRELLDQVARTEGPVYLHCAQGFGRSATLAAAVLIARGHARDIADAERVLRTARPGVRLNALQRKMLAKVVACGAGL